MCSTSLRSDGLSIAGGFSFLFRSGYRRGRPLWSALGCRLADGVGGSKKTKGRRPPAFSRAAGRITTPAGMQITAPELWNPHTKRAAFLLTSPPENPSPSVELRRRAAISEAGSQRQRPLFQLQRVRRRRKQTRWGGRSSRARWGHLPGPAAGHPGLAPAAGRVGVWGRLLCRVVPPLGLQGISMHSGDWPLTALPIAGS